MSNYIPQGWTASKKTRQFINSHYQFVKRIVEGCVNKYYSVCGMEHSDLLQEGMLAATYAVDTYNAEKGGQGKLHSYINIVVRNSLGMVASAANAAIRNPMVWVHDGEKWIKTRQTISGDLECVEDIPRNRPDRVAEWVEEEREHFRKRHERWQALNAIETAISPLASAIFRLKRNPPADFVVMSRNMCPKERYTVNILAKYTSAKRSHVKGALKEIDTAIEHYKSVAKAQVVP